MQILHNLKLCYIFLPGSATEKKTETVAAPRKDGNPPAGTEHEARKKETTTTGEPAAPVTHPATLDTTHNHAAPAKMETRSTGGTTRPTPPRSREKKNSNTPTRKDGNKQTDQHKTPSRKTRTTEHETPSGRRI